MSEEITERCPECDCAEYLHKNAIGIGYRVCAKCGQEWWTDVDYTKKSNWKSEFQYLLNRKILTRDELGYLFGQIQAICDRETKPLHTQIEQLKAELDEAIHDINLFQKQAEKSNAEIEQLKAENKIKDKALQMISISIFRDADGEWETSRPLDLLKVIAYEALTGKALENKN